MHDHPRAWSVLAAALVQLCSCSSDPACVGHLIEFDYLKADTTDVLQPGNKAGAQFLLAGNPNMLLGGVSILAWPQAATNVYLSLYEDNGGAPDAGPFVVTSNVAAAAPALTPTDPNALPTLTFAIGTGARTLDPNVSYWAVITTAAQPLTLGIKTAGQYAGAYQTFSTSGWQPSAESTERVALALQSPACP